jgi:hypothetical protein
VHCRGHREDAGILNISAGWFIAAALLLAIKPMMTFFGSDRPS